MADPGAQTNWLDVAKAALWPVFALLFMLSFGRPLALILGRVAAELGPAQEVDVGPIKVQFSPASVARLPAPPTETAHALAKMRPGDIETLLGMSETGRMVVCTLRGLTAGATDFRRQEATKYDALAQIGLVDYADEPGDTLATEGCTAGQTKGAKLTELGRTTRSYLLSVIENALSFSRS